MAYLCPICEKGYITITQKRTGPKGFRETETDIVDKTCSCITAQGDLVAIGIMNYKNKDIIEHDICEDCGVEKATMHYPINHYVGKYKDICTKCFKIEIEKK